MSEVGGGKGERVFGGIGGVGESECVGGRGGECECVRRRSRRE